MWKNVKVFFIAVGFTIQLISVILFGFTNIPISSGMYLVIFSACTIMIWYFLHALRIN